MERGKPHNPSPLLGLLCSVFGHDYILTRKTPEDTNKYQCAWCEKQAAHHSLENIPPESSRMKRFRKNLPSLF